ncbi:hypothetical protein VIBNIAM115_550022 [Vibrio nigripulchritudo AM115]|nr:hypothetical protein VIBNIAM115_550022 [Vibrio nigripulchritudo AM115]
MSNVETGLRGVYAIEYTETTKTEKECFALADVGGHSLCDFILRLPCCHKPTKSYLPNF